MGLFFIRSFIHSIYDVISLVYLCCSVSPSEFFRCEDFMRRFVPGKPLAQFQTHLQKSHADLGSEQKYHVKAQVTGVENKRTTHEVSARLKTLLRHGWVGIYKVLDFTVFFMVVLFDYRFQLLLYSHCVLIF